MIDDDNDEPTVGFEKPVYEVVEPAEGQMQRLRICVVRTGDLTAELEGRVHTKVIHFSFFSGLHIVRCA